MCQLTSHCDFRPEAFHQVYPFESRSLLSTVGRPLKVHCKASIPRDSPGFDVARWILGRLSLQLLPLVSNKHPISLLSGI